MPTLFNHTIVAARDKQQAASFFTEMFGLPAAEPGGFFLVGRGVYFCDLSGHYLEAITQPYGSGTAA